MHLFISGTLESTIKKDLIAREGILDTIKIPTSLRNKPGLDFTITDGAIVLTEGEHTYFYTDELGIAKETIVVIFFTTHGVVGYIDYGTIYMKDDEGSIYSFNKEGVSAKVEDNIQDITFLTRKKMYEQLKMLVSFRYNLHDNNVTVSYLNNLAIVLNLAWDAVVVENIKSHILNFKVLDYFTDLGAGAIEFKMLPREVAVSYTGEPNGEDEDDDDATTTDDDTFTEDDEVDEDDDSEGDTRY